MQRITLKKIQRVSYIWTKHLMWARKPYSKEHKKACHLHQIEHYWCSCKVGIEVTTFDWSETHTWVANTTRTWPVPILIFFYIFYISPNCTCEMSIPCWVDV